ncbi:hypothetical protein B0H13DRAFT_2358092 [Mycena leptocephala]|nr:hypothetical protein B0H13DRAFT_2358092 [Mycena leptocephala]
MTTEFKLSQLIFPPPTTSPIVAPSSPFQRPSISFPWPYKVPTTKNGVICPAFLTQASKAYEVDIDTYTCTCLDYPLISYCKHICAVQQFFDEDGGLLDGIPASPNVPCLPPSLDEPVALAALPNDAILAPVAPRTSSVPKPGPLVVVAEKLERLAARLRRPNKIASPSLVDLEEAVDAMLLATDHLAVLPSTQYFAPVVKQSSARQAMLPGIKTRRARAGDKAYGAGAGSGALAKPDAKAAKTAKKAKKAKTATTPLPPVPPASDAQQQQPSAVYYPAHFNPFYYPAQYQLPYYPATSTTSTAAGPSSYYPPRTYSTD